MDKEQARAQAIRAHPEMDDEAIAALVTRMTGTPYERAAAELKAAIARDELADAKAGEARVKAGGPGGSPLGDFLAQVSTVGEGADGWAGQSGRDFLRPEVVGVEHSRPHEPIKDEARSVSRIRKG